MVTCTCSHHLIARGLSFTGDFRLALQHEKITYNIYKEKVTSLNVCWLNQKCIECVDKGTCHYVYCTIIPGTIVTSYVYITIAYYVLHVCGVTYYTQQIQIIVHYHIILCGSCRVEAKQFHVTNLCDHRSGNLHSLHIFQFLKNSQHRLQCIRSGYSKFSKFWWVVLEL